MRSVRNLLIGIVISIGFTVFSLPAIHAQDISLPEQVVDSILVDLKRYDDCKILLHQADSTIQVYSQELDRRDELIKTIKLQGEVYDILLKELKIESKNKDVIISDYKKKLLWHKIGEAVVIILIIAISL